MNTVQIIVQAKDDPKNLLSSLEKAAAFEPGLTVVFMESATVKGQLGIELIFKGKDLFGKETIIGATVTENNWEALMGAFIGVRMRFGRMPQDQFEMVRHYVKQQARRFLQTLSLEKLQIVGEDVKKFFGINN